MTNTRRRFLLTAAAASTTALAGCSDNNTDEEEDVPEPTTGSTPKPSGEPHEIDIPESDEYTIREARGQTVHLQDGDTYENVIWDLTTGDDVTINTIGVEDWTIRNVGFYGHYHGGSYALLTLGAMDGSTGRVENVYIGDGASEEGTTHRPTAPSAVLVEEHEGHIDFVDCNIQGFPEAGVSAPSKAGTCSWENCYIGNNGIVSVRADNDGELRDCVLFNDGTTYGEEELSPSGTLVSAFQPGGTELYNTHLAAGDNEALSSDANVEGNIMHSGELSGAIYGPFEVADAVGNDPIIERPEGVPKSAIEAASAGQSGSNERAERDGATNTSNQ